MQVFHRLVRQFDSPKMLRFLKIVVGASTFALAMSACGGQWLDRSESRTYLDEVRPACVPIEGAINEPCARRLPWSITTYPQVSLSFTEDVIKEYPISVEEETRRSWGFGGLVTPQVIMRGTVLPSSARCVAHGSMAHSNREPYTVSPDSPLEVCYVDVSVSEYIVGRGPAVVTIVAGWRTRARTNAEGYGTPEYYRELAEPIRQTMEGIEFIFNLIRPTNLTHGEWQTYNLWDVQRKADGEIVGVSRWIQWFGGKHNLTEFEHPLAELQASMKTVHAKISAEKDGRIGDPNSPKLVTDAHREDLLEQIRELGGYDAPGITPVAAPPAQVPRKSARWR